ncbi:hypothetical protein [Helicobacter rodentium]|nr:hypothetical protein [Helicobacter rodentium]
MTKQSITKQTTKAYNGILKKCKIIDCHELRCNSRNDKRAKLPRHCKDK